jgi:hypothetical protein
VSTSANETVTAHTIHRLLATPMEKMLWYSERAVKARSSSEQHSVMNAMVCAASTCSG